MSLGRSQTNLQPRAGDALIVVDLQKDFCSGGSLAVPGAERLIPLINELIRRFQEQSLPVVATRDWHPGDHCSFEESGGRWPPHCVQGTAGAEFVDGLELPAESFIVSKGTDRDRDSFSGFFGGSLAAFFESQDVRRVFVCGVATEYCVLETARDALDQGFETVLLGEGIKAIDHGNGQRAIRELLRHGALLHDPTAAAIPPSGASTLLVDLYQLTMLQGYFDRHMEETAVFEFFVRKLPEGRNFLVAAGLEQALEYLEDVRFAPDELQWLADSGLFRDDFIHYLEQLRFAGDVHAMPEGTVFFPDEPIVRVTAPLPQAQLVESRLINLFQFQTLIASKAARSVLAAPDRLLVDFGMRRAHGAEAGLLAARAACLVGFAGTATVQAGQRFGVDLYGTMAHSFVQAHDQELDAFERFAVANPNNVVLLIDTYDTEAAARCLPDLSKKLRERGISIKGVRLDSGDLAEHARQVRRILDDGGLADVTIFASGNLDEYKLRDFAAVEAPIDGFGIGSRLDVSADAPYLDCAYKLQEYAGRARRKQSEGKATWPGRKQVFRSFENGIMTGDVIALENDPQPGTPLLQPVMVAGRLIEPAKSIDTIRQQSAENLAQLPPALRELDSAAEYPVTVAASIQELARTLDEKMAERGAAGTGVGENGGHQD